MRSIHYTVYTQEFIPRYLFYFTEQKHCKNLLVITGKSMEAGEVDQVDLNFKAEAKEASEALKPPIGTL